ncbi:hydroxyacid dehydrogenase [Mangrovactinospora gilvigrisea]|uniref:Hydroxyacid dehydrogenase n=1 Tax=Mangrovactinospora gilvigrisea TaxID=1428644 RepID=A0A1J7C2S4_9ACTN|nr:D-2-hydroxyacid dehydrogenase family protein [Mangrovactinospora gilvigrisea]OIV35868.1 hydroxyacid dehydrogenase [Mangrovactinospora gilvigrisea]
MTVRVAVLDDYQRVAEEAADWGRLPEGVEVEFYPHPLGTADEIVKELADYPIVVAMRERTAFPRELLARLPELRLLVTTGMKNAAIDVAAAGELGITVCGTAMAPTPTAELTWGLILGVARHIPEEDRAVREGRWQHTVGVGLSGKTLGVIGLGRLGRQVAAIGQAFGMNVVAWSQNLTPAAAAEAGVQKAADLDELLRMADVVTIHTRLSERTRGLIGERRLGLMRPTAILVNTSRAPIVDMEALGDAVREGRLGGVGIDVYEDEPLAVDDPVRGWEPDRTVLTPHLGYVTGEGLRLSYGEAVEDIAAFLTGEPVRVLS